MVATQSSWESRSKTSHAAGAFRFLHIKAMILFCRDHQICNGELQNGICYKLANRTKCSIQIKKIDTVSKIPAAQGYRTSRSQPELCGTASSNTESRTNRGEPCFIHKADPINLLHGMDHWFCFSDPQRWEWKFDTGIYPQCATFPHKDRSSFHIATRRKESSQSGNQKVSSQQNQSSRKVNRHHKNDQHCDKAKFL